MHAFKQDDTPQPALGRRSFLIGAPACLLALGSLATATAVVEANMVPVFAVIGLETFNLDPEAVQAAITPKTLAEVAERARPG